MRVNDSNRFDTATVSNCVLTDNSAYTGGGAAWGTLDNCTLTGNSAGFEGGGAANCTLNNCTLTGNSVFDWLVDFFAGGGASSCTLNNCTLTGNYADFFWGGASDSTLSNCTLTGNRAGSSGGGAFESTLKNCTLTGNSAAQYGGGAGGCMLYSCIIYFNQPQNYPDGWGSLTYCCTTPLPTNGIGNITNAPLFIDTNGWANLRLQSNSPCINAGNNSYATSATDLDGNPRIVGGTVDIGAYEYQSLDLIGPGMVSNQFGFTVTGQSNWVIVLEASSDFANWTPLTTNTLNGSPFPFRDPTPPNLPQRFYRARLSL